MNGNNRLRPSSEAILLSAFAILFIGSIGFLSRNIDRGLDPDNGKSWWTLSFETRDPGSLVFSIDNHSDSTRFTYSILQGQDILGSDTVEMPKGSRETVSPSVSSNQPSRVVVSVRAEDGSEKSIYR